MSAGTQLARVVPCVDGSGLAVIVALVDVDDAMVERLRRKARREDDTVVVDRADLLALLSALTPPEA